MSDVPAKRSVPAGGAGTSGEAADTENGSEDGVILSHREGNSRGIFSMSTVAYCSDSDTEFCERNSRKNLNFMV